MDTFNDLAECVAALTPQPLPALTASLEKYQEMLASHGDSVIKLTNIVLTDPGLICTLIRAAINVPRKNLQSDIRTVDHAMLLMGSSNAGKVVAQAAVIENLCQEPALTEYKKILSRVYHSAYQAYDFARNLSDLSADEVLTATMLQELGRMMLCAYYPDRLLPLLEASEEEQTQALGFSFSDLSQALAKEWQLSAFMQMTLNPEAKQRVRACAVDLGMRVGWAVEKGWENKEAEQLLLDIAEALREPPEAILSAIWDNAELAADETPYYEVAPAIINLPPVPGKEPRVWAAPDGTPYRRTGEQTKPQPVIQKPKIIASTDETGCPIDAELLSSQIKALEDLIHNGPQLNQLMTMTMNALHEGVKLDRAIFMMLDRDRRHLKARFVMGAQSSPTLKTFSQPMSQGTLFDALMAKPQALWVRNDNRAKIWPLVPADFSQQINTQSFYMMSFWLKAKPVGLFYADRNEHAFGLDPNSYAYFRKICNLAAKGLGQLSR